MKKLLAILGMVTCMAGLTACGQTATETQLLPETQAIEEGKYIVESLNQMYLQGVTENEVEDAIAADALKSWIAAQEEMGGYVGVLETSADISAEEAVISIIVDGTSHDATVEIVVDKDLNLTSVTTTVIKTLGEMMINAALNTLIGMGTVFVVLILISLLISLFGLIPKIQAAMSKKKENVQEKAVDNAVAQIIENEEQSDDLELVAVIAAAIAASEGAASTDGYVVRSIRRRF